MNSNSGPLAEGEHGVFRGHVTVSEQDLAVETVKLSFGMISDEGWVYVNGQMAGESHDWQATPGFDVKHFASRHNIIRVAVKRFRLRRHKQGRHPAVPGKTRIAGMETQRSSTGWPQLIVQSTGQPGEILLTATSPGLTRKVLAIQAQPAPLRPSVPSQLK